ncbi:DUF3973 domain-containing protein [Ammoniphilus resinae]|uniref:DUF3973 domain-containing protein n=1 Tax=Ammoniphilus resinae TaxID=861532 RepID=A0ABS4GIP1_9BACL|nr:hypothetical protein [Ammoniphilus resinae]
MYHCLACNEIHHHDESAEKIFNSGYTLVHDTKVPLGVCKKLNDLKRVAFAPHFLK